MAVAVGDDGVPRRKRNGVRVVEMPVAHGFNIRSVPELLRAGVAAAPPVAETELMARALDLLGSPYARGVFELLTCRV